MPNTAAPPDVTDEMLVEAMREFERFSSVLRYPEKQGWHVCDMVGMRHAIAAAMMVAVVKKAEASHDRQ